MKKLLFFTFAAIMFAACAKDAINERGIQPIVDNAPEPLTVGFDEDTRIQLNEAAKAVWTTGDIVSVFYRSNANQKWQYQGETGARTANLKRVNAGTATRDMDRIVVVYPYNEDYYINPSTFNVQATLPATQTYLKDSYGLDGNIMISSAEYNQVALKNVCGWLKLQLTGDGEKVKSITFRGNNGEQVAGELYINSMDATAALAADMGDIDEDEGENTTGGAGGNLVFDDTILTKVTLDCGEGVELGAEATAFYIALPPQTFTVGFTVEIEATDGHVMEKVLEREFSIERNTIQPMAIFKFTSVIDLSTDGTSNCYIVSDVGYYKFNANVIGNGNNGIIPNANFHTNSTYISPSKVELVWDDNNVVSKLYLEEGFVYFTASPNKGNALIAVKDTEDNILWSWHIWATNTPNDYLDHNGYYTIDRNIGATSADYLDGEATYGLYYQWGRKDPLRYPSSIVNTDDNTGCINYTIEHPTKMIGGNFYNWQYSNKSEYLWGYMHDKKTIYDPCPLGYKVAYPATRSTAYIYDSSCPGGRWDGDLWYPFAGRLHWKTGTMEADDWFDPGVNEYGNFGYYYVNTYSNYSKNDTYDQYFSLTRVLIDNLQYKGFAESVRCIRE